jgi:AmmeMemoRadiSam system protein A
MLRLNESEQQRLLLLAREALEEAVRHHALRETTPRPEDLEGALGERYGAFVTLHKERRLRGCVGSVEPATPLWETVRECALAAALRDFRFEPVRPEELPALTVEVSVLSALADIQVDQIEVGLHGLLISHEGRRGLLLPQVPVEWNWDRERFLEETAHKAGLPRDAWRRGARLQAFTTQVFAESFDAAHSGKQRP